MSKNISMFERDVRIVGPLRGRVRYGIYAISAVLVVLGKVILECLSRLVSFITDLPIHVILAWFDDLLWYKAMVWLLLALVLLVIVNECLIYKKKKAAEKKREIENEEMRRDVNMEPFVYDTPAEEDLMGREGHARIIVRKILNTFRASKESGRAGKNENTGCSFVIHLGENYGMGKTTFIKMIENVIKTSNNNCVQMDFNPWMCDNAAGILKEFFLELREHLKDAGIKTKDNCITDYAIALLSSMTIGTSGVTVDVKEVMKKRQSLRKLHDNVSNGLKECEVPVIISIDDVDRLEGDEVMMVMKIIRDTADFPNIFYIVAADNTRLREVLRERGVDDPDQYLKKFFNLEYQLPANDNTGYKVLLRRLSEKYKKMGIEKWEEHDIDGSIGSIGNIKLIFGDIREVKRFVNVYFLHLDTMSEKASEDQSVKDLNIDDLFSLCLIKFLDPEYYVVLRDQMELILEIYKEGNDKVLKWREELNIPKMRDDKKDEEASEQLAKDIKKGRGEDISKMEDKKKEETRIPAYEETWKKMHLDRHETVMSIMSSLFSGSMPVEENRICRVNMYYRYFAFEQASYMVGRLEVMAMMKMDEKEYAVALDKIFEEKRDEAFIGEFTYLASNPDYGKIDMLRRHFIYVWTAYKHKKWMRHNYERDYGLAQYQNFVFHVNETKNVTHRLYSKWTVRDDKSQEKAARELHEFCENYMKGDVDEYFKEMKDVAVDMLLQLILKGVNVHLSELIFSISQINDMCEVLYKRFMNERLSEGWLDDETVSTLYALRDNLDWEKKLRERMNSDNAFCLNFLSNLLILSEDGSQLYPDDLLAHVIMSANNSSGGKLIGELKNTNRDKEKILDNMVNIINQSNNKNMDTNEMSPTSTNPFVMFVIRHRHNHGGYRRKGKREG